MLGGRKTTVLILLFLVLGTSLSSYGTVRAVDYPRILEERAASVIPVKFTVKLTVTRKGKSNTRQLSGTANGLLVSDNGLMLMSARQLKGPGMFNQTNKRGINLETVARNFRARMPDGTRLKATLKARDEGLDLAFVRIKKSVENYEGVRPVTLPEEPPELTVGQPVIHVSRHGEGLNYQPQLLTTRLSSLVQNPRLRYGLMDGLSMLGNFIGSPAFNESGELIGMATFRGDGSSKGAPASAANPYSRMSRNKQFLLPVQSLKQAVSNYASR